MKRNLFCFILLLLVSNSGVAQFPISLGNLQDGDTLTIIYDVGVSTFPPTKNTVSSQLKVSGNGFGPVLSDDPATVAASDATVTDALSPFTLTYSSKSNPSICLGTDGKIVFSTNVSDGNYSFNYQKNSGGTLTSTVSVASGVLELTGLSSGTYSNFAISGFTSEISGIQILSDPPTQTLIAGTLTDPSTCLGTDGKIAFTSTNLGDGTYTLNYTKGTTSTSQSVTVSSNAFELTGLGAGSYSAFSVTVNGCQGSLSTTQTLSDPPTPTLTAATLTDPSTCLGTDGKIAFTSTNLGDGTYTLNYTKGTTATSQSVTVSSSAFELTGLGAGSYSAFSVTVNGCQGSLATAQTLSDPPTPTLTAGTLTDPSTCLGTDGKITFTSTNLADGTYTLNYTKGTTATSQSVTVSSNAFELTGLGAGSYSAFSVTVNGCQGSLATAQTLSDPPTPTLTAGTLTDPSTCLGTDGKITFTSTNLADGTYTLNYTKGTTATSQSVTVSSNAFELTGLGAESYSAFSVTVNGCQGSLSTAQTLSDPPTPTLSAGTLTDPSTCLGTDGKIAFTSTNLADGSYTLNYTKGTTATSQSVTVSSNAFELTGLGAGSYSAFSVTVNGCQGSLTAAQTLSDPPTPTLNLDGSTDPSTCNGADGIIRFTTSLVNDSYEVTFKKNSVQQTKSGTAASGILTLVGLEEGTYTEFSVIVNNCTGSYSATDIILSDPVFVPSVSNTGPYEEGETAHLNATGGVTYNWSGPGGFFSTLQSPFVPDLSSGKSGIYSVSITSIENCQATLTTEVLVSCSSQNLNYYLVYGGSNPEIIAPLVSNLQVQANSSRPMSVVAFSACEVPLVESVKLQLSGTSNLQYYVDNEMPFNLHENMNVSTGDILIPNHYTLIGNGYSMDNATGSVLVGPNVIPFDVVWYGREINNISLSSSQICSGSGLTVSATATETPFQKFGASNLFQVYMSDADGQFIDRTLIGSGSSIGSINCQIPEYIPSGANYKVMITSTEPVVSSEISMTTLQIIGNDLTLISPNDDINNQSVERLAKGAIKGANKIAGSLSNVKYKASKFIELTPGFVVNSSSVFEAKIENPCP
ncbi:3-coathanger stack domain-containing protein [Jiulongibacter sediminis]|uniref:Uncharacterized protein n=1 Tax=Jiulongibacter sediminis TaxID=1605367 RepID=A0A0P7C8G8_9BACT|nr:3-coathanger stack domain-containing protein [Jiulongibacter sediminis]KPM48824.1 hypothetical protein AFM12_09625 [Jiulongibacter sediminis]TBX25355.1 hypothetical protein TK44_09630 [Jiulongibacter sediminis]